MSTADDKNKTVDIKLWDDSTGTHKVIPVPAPETLTNGKGDDEGDDDDEMDVDTIARLAFAIRQQRLRGKSPEQVKEMYPEFQCQFPVLCNKCCDLGFSLSKLEFMLGQLQSVRTSASSKDAATDVVLQNLNHTYVDGVVDKLERERLAKERNGQGTTVAKSRNQNNKKNKKNRRQNS